MEIYDLFCDASIDLETKTACAGCTVVNNINGSVVSYGIIQKNATNNSAEVLAIWLGVNKALEIRNRYLQSNETCKIRFRLFSDSKVSLFGVKTWIYSWIRNQTAEGVLINSSGAPVANQMYFIDIFNIIVRNNLHIEFYHQRGHVSLFDSRKLDKAYRDFKNSNSIPVHRLGISINYISKFNNIVDQVSRDVVHQYDLEGYKPFKGSNFKEEAEYPMEFTASQRDVETYRNLISDGRNRICVQ